MHRLEVKQDEHYAAFVRAVEHRAVGQPLITVSNHTCPIDDPVVLGAMLPVRLCAFRPELMR
jgi:hypothetical protein